LTSHIPCRPRRCAPPRPAVAARPPCHKRLLLRRRGGHNHRKSLVHGEHGASVTTALLCSPPDVHLLCNPCSPHHAPARPHRHHQPQHTPPQHHGSATAYTATTPWLTVTPPPNKHAHTSRVTVTVATHPQPLWPQRLGQSQHEHGVPPSLGEGYSPGWQPHPPEPVLAALPHRHP
jgi:hypothetical protein